MNAPERRRYFRINETIGLSVQILDQGRNGRGSDEFAPNTLEMISKDDRTIQSMIDDLADENPKIAQVLDLLNQKIERTVSVVAMESNLLERIAYRVQEVNISACGLAFLFEEAISVGSRIRLEMTLQPNDTKLRSDGIVVACERMDAASDEFYCRVDFCGMSASDQEELIQYIVQSQSLQLRNR